MTSHSGPLYEVTFFVAPDSVEAFEQRIGEHARAILLDPAVEDCTLYPGNDDDEGRKRRVCLYALSGDDVIDDFIDGPAGELEAQLRAEFDDEIDVSARVLREDQISELIPEASANCLNCGSRLRGQYCGTCGQRSRSRLISLWELVSDAFGDLFEIDSRLWQTLIPLLVRPGRLTADYLQGKRARFMPPFRMYLVLSLLFFVVAFFDPREEFSLLFEPQPEPTPEEVQQQAEDREAAAAEARATIEELVEEGVVDEEDLSGNLQVDESGVRFTFDDDDDDEGEGEDSESDCNVTEEDVADLPEWLARRMTPERLQRVCERTRLDDGKALIEGVLDNIPAALIILLPLMAFVLKALYPLSKRYYVEHLLFFVHFHAFFFLMLTLQILFLRFSNWVGIPDALSILVTVVTSFYIAIYLFVAMRTVYGQGRFVTFLKYSVLLIAYLFGFTATMLAALAIAAFSIAA
ncbi:MAG: DUF3667 domain-containing protein [Woeseiaceae bacterium]|nr:DUF3667 domain-containing protein [Woeseiaceae bacterium]